MCHTKSCLGYIYNCVSKLFTLFLLLERRSSRPRQRAREVFPEVVDLHLQGFRLRGAASRASHPCVVGVQKRRAFTDRVYVIWK